MKTIGQKLISLLMVPAIIVGSLLLVTQPVHAVESVEYVEKSWDATAKKVVSETKTAYATAITSDTEYIQGWCYVSGSIESKKRLIVEEGKEANIILTDGSSLTVNDGINVHHTSRLNIYAQAEGTGVLYCEADTNNNAAIGSNDDSGPNGPITIHGGKITADALTHGTDGAGIGAGNTGAGGTITIYDGTVKAWGGDYAAGIGSGDADGEGRNSGTITIYGGDVTAYGGCDAAGIGGGEGANGGTVAIYGGKVKARGGTASTVITRPCDGGAGIGSGDSDGTATSGGIINIYGGEVDASGGADGAGIGGGDGCTWDTITITGGKVKATGGTYGAGLGSGMVSSGTTGGTINIGGTAEVEAKGGVDAAGIGGGEDCSGGTINISGGTVKAYGSSGMDATGGAGIGGGQSGNSGNITITGGTITETKGGSHAAGIGGGCGGLWDTIIITGGTVNATGGKYGAGIGGGDKDSTTVSTGTINISGGIITANGGLDGAGIGGGECTTGGNINISGGTVTASGLANADNSCGAGIGGGDEASGGNIIISGGHVDATGGAYGAGIGNGEDGTGMATTITLKYADASSDISVKANSYRYNDGDTSVTVKMENPFMDKDTREAYAVANYTGNDLNQFKDKTLVPANTYAITVSETQNGSVVADKSRAVSESTITLTVTPDEGYQLKSGTLKAIAGEDELTLTQDASDSSKYTFSMPAADVTVAAEFIEMVPVESVSLSKEETTLERESTETLTATVLPEDTDATIVDRTVTWKSSDERVATVDGSGKVTAVTPGTATITVTATNGTEDEADDKTDTCVVTVTPKSFNITNNPAVDGVVKVKVGDAEETSAKEGETVTLITTADIDFELKEISVTDSESKSVETTEVTMGEKYTFTMPSSDVTVSATFAKVPVTILVDVGEGHVALFTEDALNQMKTRLSLQDVTISGNVLTLKGVDPSKTEYDIQSSLWPAFDNLISTGDRIDNGEWFYDVGYKSIDDYATYDSYEDDTYNDKRRSTPISDGMTYYVLWKKPYTKLEIDNGNPTCGMEPGKAYPTTPNGMMLDPENYSWKDENNERVEKFEGDKEYTFNGQIYKKLHDDLWKFFIDENNFTMTVKDAKDLEYSHTKSWIKLSFKATVEHDWAAPTYEWSKDNSSVTATRVCSNDKSHKETETVKTTAKTTEPTTSKDGKTVYTATFKNSAFKTQTKEVAIPKKPVEKIWVRLSGNTGLDTMKAIVGEGFTKNGGTVVVATKDGFKDALAAAGFAGLYKAPIVLTEGNKLSAQAQSELKRLKPARVVVVGGPVVVKDAVLNNIQKATGVKPVRYFGANSAATSAELANKGKGKWKENTAIITTNKSFKDALSVAPIAYAKGYPILLADNGTTLTKPVLDAMKNIGTKQVIIVGGELAVTKNVVNQLNENGIKVKIRLKGDNGVETSAEIAKWGLKNGMTANKMGVATSQGYSDALAGAALCGINKSVLVLADDKAMDNASFPKAYKAQIKRGYVFGGEFAVGPKTWKALNNATK